MTFNQPYHPVVQSQIRSPLRILPLPSSPVLPSIPSHHPTRATPHPPPCIPNLGNLISVVKRPGRARKRGWCSIQELGFPTLLLDSCVLKTGCGWWVAGKRIEGSGLGLDGFEGWGGWGRDGGSRGSGEVDGFALGTDSSFRAALGDID